jgi:periplasmic protein CpxP/Spy
MSLKSKFFTVLTVSGAVVLFSAAGLAQDKTTTATGDKADQMEKGDRGNRHFGKQGFGGHRGMGMRHRGMGMMLRDLNLTDAQKTQIQAILLANKPNPTPEAREEMRTLMMAKRSGLITAAQQERLTAIRADAQAKGQSVHEQILAVLTPEQKATIEQRKQQMQQKRQQWQNQKTAPPTAPKGTVDN